MQESGLDQRDGETDVLAKTSEHAGRIGKRPWVITCDLDSLPSELYGFATVFRSVIRPFIGGELQPPPRR